MKMKIFAALSLLGLLWGAPAAAQTQTVRLCVMSGSTCVPVSSGNPLPTGGGGGGGGAVFGPTAAGSPAANPPVLMGGTIDGTATGNVGVLKVLGGLAYINCANCSGSGASAADQAAFVAGTSLFAPSGGFFQTTATNSPLTTGQQGLVQMTAQRAFFVNLRNASGAELGIAAAPVQVSLANTAANGTAVTVGGTVAATQSGTWNIGTVTTLPALVAGAAIIGKVGIDQTTDGTTNSVNAHGSTSNASSGVATGSTSVAGVSFNYGFNGTTWDQLQVDSLKNLKTAEATSSTAGAIVPNNTTAVVVKASAGTLTGYQVFGIGSAPAYLKFYNATSATCGSGTPVKRIMIPAASTAANGAGANVPVNVAFSTGITYCVTTGIGDADTTAPAASTYLVNVDFK